jgi:hypothetical protein
MHLLTGLRDPKTRDNNIINNSYLWIFLHVSVPNSTCLISVPTERKLSIECTCQHIHAYLLEDEEIIKQKMKEITN